MPPLRPDILNSSVSTRGLRRKLECRVHNSNNPLICLDNDPLVSIAAHLPAKDIAALARTCTLFSLQFVEVVVRRKASLIGRAVPTTLPSPHPRQCDSLTIDAQSWLAWLGAQDDPFQRRIPGAIVQELTCYASVLYAGCFLDGGFAPPARTFKVILALAPNGSGKMQWHLGENTAAWETLLNLQAGHFGGFELAEVEPATILKDFPAYQDRHREFRLPSDKPWSPVFHSKCKWWKSIRLGNLARDVDKGTRFPIGPQLTQVGDIHITQPDSLLADSLYRAEFPDCDDTKEMLLRKQTGVNVTNENFANVELQNLEPFWVGSKA